MKEISTEEVLNWARDFLAMSENEITPEELKEQKKYAILIQNPNDKMLLSKLLDESSQIHDSKKLARRMRKLIQQYGVPQFFSATDVLQLKLFTSIGYLFDFISVPLFKQRLRSDTAKIIINEQTDLLTQHLSGRKKQQIGQNVNLLGEVVLGDGEADHRFYHYLEALKDPQINYISIKISGIYAQINALNYEQNKADLCDRLSSIYRQAIKHTTTDNQGNQVPKFVNLDMEEYKDTELTLDVFKTVLSLKEFKNYPAGIVVQAYLPDAWNFQSELLEFAKKRTTEGGAPLKMRLVKGANLQMESIISSLKGWSNPVLPTKVEVDANYLHILDRALIRENAEALHVGVASHNFFSIGYAQLLSKVHQSEGFVTFEMLEGMANHLPRVMRNLGKQIILYTPVVKDEHFLNAVSYLVRRLDENTGKDNFLSYSFNLKYDSEQWHFLQKQFLEAFSLKEKISHEPFRTQNRLTEALPAYCSEEFINEPDTNFDLAPNREWAAQLKKAWQKQPLDLPYQIPVQVGDQFIKNPPKQVYLDRCQDNEICVCKAGLADMQQVSEIISIAEQDTSAWRKTDWKNRKDILFKTGDLLAAKRGQLIGCMAAITGKTLTEGDVEVSEAVDFCRFYPLSMKPFMELETVQCTPKGIVLVIPPWNFPLAIPVGGVAAALAAGNSVILKPATVAYPVAWEFVQCFWEAGVPKDALQIVCTDGREPLNMLTAHPSIRHIILTGGTDTAFRLLKNNPTCPLSAETGGKNAIIVTSSADRDHAIQNIISSAFSNAGQKCSACSLLLLEREIFEDDDFKKKMIDAVKSLHTGSVWNGANTIGPMIDNDNDKLQHAIDHLEEGEWWLVAPEYADKNKFMLKPCVKWGVKPGSFTFSNELFAPLLAVVCIDDLEQGIQFVNNSEYGLTSGLQSLDEEEQEKWKNSIEAGNLYINRGITGAIVNRQPFGGMKRSAFGGGIKAGGKNYVSCFMDITEIGNFNNQLPLQGNKYCDLLDETDKRRCSAAIQSYQMAYESEFALEKPTCTLLGERNSFRYLPLTSIGFRILPTDKLCDIIMVLAATEISKASVTISIDSSHPYIQKLNLLCNDKIKLLHQTENDFVNEMHKYDRIRTCTSQLPAVYYEQAALLGKYIANVPPVTEGRLELLHYLKEQSISFEYHRYGSIPETEGC